jgi:hypothetical protein
MHPRRLESVPKVEQSEFSSTIAKDNYISSFCFDAGDRESALFLLDFVAVLPIDVLLRRDCQILLEIYHIPEDAYCGFNLSLQSTSGKLIHSRGNFT